MSRIQIKSIFEQIAERAFTIKDITQAQHFITEFVNSKEINDVDKQNIIKKVNECKNIIGLQSYICNSLLKYEGLSVGIPKTEKKEKPED